MESNPEASPDLAKAFPEIKMDWLFISPLDEWSNDGLENATNVQELMALDQIYFTSLS